MLGNHSLLLLHLDSLLIAFWSMTFSMNCHILPHCYNFTLIMLCYVALLPAAFERSGWENDMVYLGNRDSLLSERLGLLEVSFVAAKTQQRLFLPD